MQEGASAASPNNTDLHERRGADRRHTRGV